MANNTKFYEYVFKICKKKLMHNLDVKLDTTIYPTYVYQTKIIYYRLTSEITDTSVIKYFTVVTILISFFTTHLQYFSYKILGIIDLYYRGAKTM